MPDSATILLVDDEEAVQKLLTYPLEHEGFRVLQARDGEEALLRFAGERVDLVVLDLMLPKLDGLEVCRRLRTHSTVPIIMLTARDDELDKVVGLELGADDYITKPFSIREFRSRVRALLRRAAIGSQPDGGGRDRRRRAPDRRLQADGRGARRARRADVRRVRAPPDDGRPAGPRLQPPGTARGALGRLRVPRAADDRRPRPPPAREAGAWIRASRSSSSPFVASATASGTRPPAAPRSHREPVPQRRRPPEPRPRGGRRRRARRGLGRARAEPRAAPRQRQDRAADPDGARPASGRRARPASTRTSSTTRPTPRARGPCSSLRSPAERRRRCSSSTTRSTSASPATSAATRSRSGPRRQARCQRGRVGRDGTSYAEVGDPRQERQRSPLLELAPGHARQRRPRQVAPPLGRTDCACRVDPRRLRPGVRLRPADSPARAGGRADRRRRLQRAGGRLASGRARPAGRRLRPDAAPAGTARRRPSRVHRQRVARAADADLLARRLRRADAGRGSRRGDAARVSRDDVGAGGAAVEARDRSSRPLAARRGPDAARAGARFARRRRPRAARGVRCGRAAARPPARGRRRAGGRRSRRPRPHLPDRAGADRQRAAAHAARHAGADRRPRAGAGGARTTAPGSPPRRRSRCSPASRARRVAGLRDGARAGDRAGARRADGRRARARARRRAGRSSRSSCRRRSGSRSPRPFPPDRFHGKSPVLCRPVRAVVIVILAALVGAAAALGLGRATGLVGSGGSTVETVVVHAPAPATSRPAAVRTIVPATATGLSAARIFALRAPGVVTVFSYFADGTAAQGSGFVVSATGTVLTNAHVVTNAGETAVGTPVSAAKNVYVEFADHDRVPAKIVGWDVYDDVGVIRVSGSQHALVPLPLGRSAGVVVGEPVAAIGSPLGNQDSLAVGVVSAVRRSIAALTVAHFQIVDAIQTDAPITHGSSGGPAARLARPRDRDQRADSQRLRRQLRDRLRRSHRRGAAVAQRPARAWPRRVRVRRAADGGHDARRSPRSSGFLSATARSSSGSRPAVRPRAPAFAAARSRSSSKARES